MEIQTEPSSKATPSAVSSKTKLPEILRANEKKILADWTDEQLRRLGHKITPVELRNQCEEFLRQFTECLQSADAENINSANWKPVRDFLASVSRTRGVQGFSPTETATFVFSLKKPLFEAIRTGAGANVVEDLLRVTQFLDGFGLYTTEVYQKAREEVIARQQQDLLELSTPVVKLWDGILALPMIGTLDSSRTQVVMETLLQKIVETNSELAIIDITGVPTVDTLVAQHLIKTVTAARLMGAECLISGVRPQIAATIVHLGVDLGNITTKATLADAFSLALSKLNRKSGRDAAARALTRGSSREVRA